MSYVGLFGMRSLEVLNHAVDPRQVGVIANPHTQGNRLLSGRAAAQRQHHYSSQNHCQQLFHREVPPLFYLTRLSAARMTVLCITQLFAENTECSMTAKAVCYVLIRRIRAFAPSPERRCGAAAVRFPACPSERGRSRGRFRRWAARWSLSAARRICSSRCRQSR